MSRLRMAWPVLGLILWVGALAPRGAAAASGETVEWKSFDKGLKDAQASRKYSFVDVYTQWCGYCKMLEHNTLTHKAVLAELGKNFVSIKLDAESEEEVMWQGKKMSKRELAARWGVEGFPTMLFLNSKGEIIGSFPSYAEADLMINLLKYISSGARERKVSFEDYLKKSS
jgi:thioredoxin-related protein